MELTDKQKERLKRLQNGREKIKTDEDLGLVANKWELPIEDWEQDDWNTLIVQYKIDTSILRKYDTEWDYSLLPRYQKLSMRFIEENKECLNWYYVCKCQKLSESFMRKHARRLNWKQIGWYQNLSDEFQDDYVDSLVYGRYMGKSKVIN